MFKNHTQTNNSLAKMQLFASLINTIFSVVRDTLYRFIHDAIISPSKKHKQRGMISINLGLNIC